MTDGHNRWKSEECEVSAKREERYKVATSQGIKIKSLQHSQSTRFNQGLEEGDRVGI